MNVCHSFLQVLGDYKWIINIYSKIITTVKSVHVNNFLPGKRGCSHGLVSASTWMHNVPTTLSTAPGTAVRLCGERRCKRSSLFCSARLLWLEDGTEQQEAQTGFRAWQLSLQDDTQQGWLSALCGRLYSQEPPEGTSTRRTSPAVHGVTRRGLYIMAAVTGFPQSLPSTPQYCAQHICFPGFLRSNLQGQVKKNVCSFDPFKSTADFQPSPF